MFCSKCGTQVPVETVFCHKCGEKFSSQPHESSQQHQPRDSPESSTIKSLIRAGNLAKAEELLSSFSERNAEWHFLMGALYYRKNIIDESYKNFRIAVELEPQNLEFSTAFNQVKKRSGKILFCHECVTQIPKGTRLCHKCGEKVTVQRANPTKGRWVGTLIKVLFPLAAVIILGLLSDYFHGYRDPITFADIAVLVAIVVAIILIIVVITFVISINKK